MRIWPGERRIRRQNKRDRRLMLLASNFLLWIVVALLAVATAALARQVSALREQVVPAAAEAVDCGPAPGEAAPVVSATTLGGRALVIGSANDLDQPVMLLFVAPRCPVSKKIIPVAMMAARHGKLKLVFVGPAAPGAYDAMRKRLRMGGYDFVASREVCDTFRIGKLPAAVLISPDGRVAAKSAIGGREHLERLVASHEAARASGRRRGSA